jgi:hypothetical protein
MIFKKIPACFEIEPAKAFSKSLKSLQSAGALFDPWCPGLPNGGTGGTLADNRNMGNG